VLTDLRNHAMPLIRYKIGDKGMLLKDPCPCGRKFQLMRPLAGRASEYIILPDGEQLSPYRFTTLIENIPGLLQFQIIQIHPKHLRVKTVLKAKNQMTTLNQIKEKLQQLTHNQMVIAVENCDRLEIEDNGKFKVVKNLVNLPCEGEL
jgi:phenylacetate-CoA ligase